MNRFLKIISLFFIFIFIFWNKADASINMTVSPIKYEIEVDPGNIITRTATLYNYSSGALDITTSTWEFKAEGQTWQPKILPYNPNSTGISSWVTLHTENFELAPNEKKTISFDIYIPDNATPGWHYWAVFFKYDSTSSQWATKIWVNVDYWVLLLVNVSWEIIKEWEVTDVIVKNNWGWGWYRNKKDNCPLWDFTKSNFDNKCIDEISWWDDIDWGNWTIDLTDILWDDFDSNKEDQLDIQFEIPFENKWNTHIKPTGKITLIDEDGKQIPNVWKTIILNDNWAMIWEKIVDYIPINDVGGNVLPQTKRVFEWEWVWFPYKDWEIDKDWEQIIKYWSPDEYYTKQNTPDNYVLNFWERVLERTNTKVVTAEIQVAYTDVNGEEVEFNSAKDFNIEYVDTYIWVNKYILSLLWFGGLFIFFFIITKRKKKKKCIVCEKVIEKDIFICPYCGKKQKEKKIDKKSDKKVVKNKKTSEKEVKIKKKKS